MRFVAKYISVAKPLPTYFRTVDADSLGEAMNLAKRFCRKGYTVAQVTQTFNDKE